MKLVTMILTVVALAACHVEGPGASEAKSKPDSVVENKPNKAWGLFWGKADKDGYPDQLFVLGVDIDNKTLSIRAVDWDEGRDEYVPSSNRNDCIDHYTDVERKFQGTGYSKEKGNKSLGVIVFGTEIDNAIYKVTEPDGNTVTYVSRRDREFPHHRVSGLVSNVKRLLENGEDCDQVSQSGEEEGSAAP